MTEEYLLATMALNLKRMVKAILLFLNKLKIWSGNANSQLKCLFFQQVLNYTLSLILQVNLKICLSIPVIKG